MEKNTTRQRLSKQEEIALTKRRFEVEEPEIEEKIQEFLKDFESNFKRERRYEYLNNVCGELYRRIKELEDMKERHKEMFLLENELRDAKKNYKRYYLELGVIKSDAKEDGYDEQAIENCRLVPIEKLIPGEVYSAGMGRKRMVCPFHKEKTGSFFIFLDNHYHCFGCMAHGNNAIDLIMQLRNCTFKEALDYLSRF